MCTCILKLFGAFTSRQDKIAKIRCKTYFGYDVGVPRSLRTRHIQIRCKTVARWFLLIRSDRASKKYENGRGGEF